MTTGREQEPRIAANVTAALESADRPISWLSRQTGIPRTTLSYQINRNAFPVRSLLRIATALDRDIEDLVA